MLRLNCKYCGCVTSSQYSLDTRVSKSHPQKNNTSVSYMECNEKRKQYSCIKIFLSELRRLPVDLITTVECTLRITTIDSDNSPTQYESYDIDSIENSAQQNIVENKLSQQTVVFEVAETSSHNNHFAVRKVHGYNSCNQILSVLSDCVQFLPKRLSHYKSTK